MPSSVQNLAISIDSTNVIINWDAPTTNNGLSITSYTVQILDSEGAKFKLIIKLILLWILHHGRPSKL